MTTHQRRGEERHSTALWGRMYIPRYLMYLLSSPVPSFPVLSPLRIEVTAIYSLPHKA